MDAHKAFWPFETGAKLFQRNAGGIGGENGAGLHLRLNASIDFLLEIEILRYCLDDKIGAGDATVGKVGNKPIQRVADVPALVTDFLVEVGGSLDRRRE